VSDQPDHTIRIAGSAWISANQRGHWTTRAKLTAGWRQAAGWLARQAGVPALGQTRIVAELEMVPRRRVRIDPANYAPTAKAAVDGLVDAGIWPDDSSGWVVGPDMRLGQPVKRLEEEALVLLLYGQPCCGLAANLHKGVTHAG
jgi:crossover junction endodeoxyribonuclease RusA